ncbi:hypothetical protein [Dysgonomonas massiliensis]|uniref:hypothetical protein n=1 Tax=Dysgonomonas massiliensis TaxID=2040292 RepID=UPI0011AF2E3D|nr:hypothetical protein [Dysgonomonas massiliensis]
MKHLFYSILCILLLFSCQSTKRKSDFHIDEANIYKITIVKSLYDIPLELDEARGQKLVYELNRNTAIGPTKFAAHYWVNIHFTNDSILTLKCNDLNFSIGGNSDTYKTKNENLFVEIWDEMDGDKIAWKPFTPVEKDDQNGIFRIIYNYNFSKEDMINISRVLNNYNIENKIIDNKIYYRGEEFNKELFWNYTLKSRDKQWLQDHSHNPDL